MVKSKGAALFALAMAGAAYYFKNKGQVRETISSVTNRLQGGMQNRGQSDTAPRSEPTGDWSRGNMA